MCLKIFTLAGILLILAIGLSSAIMPEKQNIEYKERGRITNKEYQKINQASDRTAANDLKELVEEFNLLRMSGAGAGTFYELA
jgi:Fic family protein